VTHDRRLLEIERVEDVVDQPPRVLADAAAPVDRGIRQSVARKIQREQSPAGQLLNSGAQTAALSATP
jgi:hypothetical protein